MFKFSARTVLELGSELISSDTIAFYELIKNAFDARSKNGAEVRFHIVLRRNNYLDIRTQAIHLQPQSQQSSRTADLQVLRRSLQSKLETSAGPDANAAFMASVDRASTPAEFIALLDSAYAEQNQIEISDSGTGMSIADLTTNFLVIGTPSRKREVDKAVSEGGNATPYLGEKGIGRLSAMRLGEHLIVETARTDDTALNVLDIDWRLFNTLDAMVDDIEITPRPGGAKPNPTWSGTRIIARNLSEDWSESRLKSLADYDFVRLTDPFLDPKDRPRIALSWNGTRIPIPTLDRNLLQHAHAKLSGRYEVTGEGPVLHCTLEAISLGFPHPLEVDVARLTFPDLHAAIVGVDTGIPISALTSVGPFDFEAYWYNRRRLSRIESIGDQSRVRELQRKASGILLFRDNFRVFPYGNDDDDWLELDRKALGRPGYSLNKTQFVGRVRISRMSNPALVDQTNREGLRTAPEQRVFISVLQHVIQGLLWNFLRATEKRYKEVAIDLGDVKLQVNELETRAKRALSKIRTLVPRTEVALVDDLQHAFHEFHELVGRAQKRIEEVEANSQQMLQMAGVGLMVEVVAHELARSSENALAALESLRGRDMPLDLRAKLDTLRAEMKTVSKRLRVLDPLSVSGRQRAEVFDLVGLVEELQEGHQTQFQRHNITFNISKPAMPLRVRAVRGMIVQILENLISNSVYWTQLLAKREARYKPVLSVTIQADPIAIYYADNGPGIAPENREKVFQYFWSLKESTKRRGLGLYIARECASYLGGKLELSEAPDAQSGRLHEFLLELPEGARAT